jgi:hypothetical protein
MTIEIDIDNRTNRAEIVRNESAEWSVAPDQIEAHLRGIERKDHPWNGMSAGDRCALADAAADAARAAAQDARNE